MIETSRLTLIPLTAHQLRLHIADTHRLEEELGLQTGHREVTEPLLSVITNAVIPQVENPATNPLYHTIWIAIDRRKNQFVAEVLFKGEPDESGTVEIGYGTYPALYQQGYTSEMVSGLIRWAQKQPDIRRIVAETDLENIASQKVLEKNHFRQFDRIENQLWWEYVFVMN